MEKDFYKICFLFIVLFLKCGCVVIFFVVKLIIINIIKLINKEIMLIFVFLIICGNVGNNVLSVVLVIVIYIIDVMLVIIFVYVLYLVMILFFIKLKIKVGNSCVIML